MEKHYTPTPFGSPLYLMAKPAGPACNLRCQYCYYLEKKDMFASAKRTNMSYETLEAYIRDYIAAQTVGSVQFTWHGGEALLRPLDFYRRAMDLQQQYGRGMHIENCLQTNGTLLTPEWCRFLHDNGWLVGVSIDGPADFHDEYRRTADHRPTHQSVMRGIRLLQQYNVEWNAMAVVNDYNADYPEEFYDFFKNIGCRYLQFTPIVERVDASGALCHGGRAGGQVTEHSVTAAQWGEFLCRVFDRWVRHDVGRVFVQLFDATLANWVGEMPGLCTMATECGHAAVMEHNGDVYACDHYVFEPYKLGNIHRNTITEMLWSERQRAFGAAKRTALAPECRECGWLKLCHGECPKNRFVPGRDGKSMVNYLCGGYRRFFEHTYPYFDYMARALAQGVAPATVMTSPLVLGAEG